MTAFRDNGKKLKIAMLGQKRVPSREGGVEIVVEELSTRMVKMGHEVTCYNRRGHHVSGPEYDRKELKEYKGVRLKSVFTLNIKGLAAVTSSAVAAVHAAFGKYDVVHFHAEGPCFFLWLPKITGKRCVATIHGLDWKREKWNGGFGSRFIKWGEKIAAKYADAIIVLDKSEQDYFLTTYGRKTVLIPNGVNRPQIRKAKEITKKFGLHKDDYILFLGRVVPEKGLTYLIDAYFGLNTDKKLVIAGGSSDTKEYLDELSQSCKGKGQVIFTGFVEGNVLDELYSNAYVYVLPSDLEGMPLSLLEAMSYGNCCVVSDIPECTDVIEDKGVIFKKSDVSDLRDKLQMLCDQNDIVKEYKSQAADFICGKYNWDLVCEQTLGVYEKVTG